MTIVEIFALVLLGLALSKNLVGFFAPRFLMKFSKNMLKGDLRVWFPYLFIVSLVLLYVSYISGISLAQWLVAGYSAILLFVSLLFLIPGTMNNLSNSILNLKPSKLRTICLVVVLLTIIGICVILR